jgi:hypothetical protein
VGSTLVTFIDSWTLNLGKAIVDVTSFGDSSDKNVGTVRNWNATVNGTLDNSDAQQIALLDQLEDGAEAATVVRLADDSTSDYWEGSSVVESAAIGSEVKGRVSVSLTLRGTGDIVRTIA